MNNNNLTHLWHRSSCFIRFWGSVLLFVSGLYMPMVSQAAVGDVCQLVPVTTLGSAHISAKNEYVLTDDVNNQSGFIWSNGLIDLSVPFDIELGVYLGSNAGVNASGFDIGADGLSFVLQNDPRGVAAQGYIGGFMGVDGDINLAAYGMTNRAVYPSVTVEFDTFNNNYMGFTGDMAADHTGIYLNGDVALPDAANTLKAATPIGVGGEIEDGKYHLTRYVWNPTTQYLTYYFDGQQIASVKYDLIKYFASPYVRFGFAAATGASKNLQKTCWVVPPVMYDPNWERSDSPASYGEALHRVVSGIQLGAAIDAESAAIPSADASADGVDDDGIVLPPLVQGSSAFITANVSGAGGYLQGWIDWNGDGDFADADEQIATNLQDNLAWDTDMTVGKIEFSVNVPATAKAATFARFRWSTALGLDATTKATDGEVEDYALSIAPPPLSCSSNPLMMRGTTTNALFSLDASTGKVVATANGSVQALVNAIGYRVSNNYLYGIRTSDRHLMMIGAGGVQLDLGAVTGLPTGNYYSGSFGTDGLLYVRAATGAMTKINVDTLTATTTTITSTQNVPDFAIHPTDGYAYGVVAGSKPIKFPMSGGAAVLFGASTGKTFGSVFTDVTGQVYLIESSTSDIYLLNTNTGSITLMGDSSPNVSGTDTSADASFCSSATFSLPRDYSDAPLTGTQYGSARHAIGAGVQLGAAITAEAAAYDSLDASADAGDDGITLPVLTQGKSATITAKVSGAGGYLQGWIDWNGDGDFADAGEQVAADIQDNLTGDTNNTAGTIEFTVNVPLTAVTTKTYARFRWSSAAWLNATASAPDGEVEDYTLTIKPAPANCPTLVTGESLGTFGTISAAQKYRNLEGKVPGYTYRAPKNLAEAEYVVTSKAYGSSVWNGFGLNITGHTTGATDDAFLLVNGSTTQGTFYQQTIPVRTNNDLEVSVWVRNWAGAAYDNASQRPTIAMQIYAANGSTLLGSAIVSNPAGASGWVQALSTVNTGSNAIIVVKLKNLSVQYAGNDFAIDDFSVKAVTLPCMVSDLGDAPDIGVGVGSGNYRTTLADNGPSHIITSGLQLGAVGPDSDSDGYNSAGTGDDADGVDDEDAISTFPSLTAGATTYSLTGIPVTNTTGKAATLYGWVDVNLNGRFDGNEVATATVASGASSTSLNWSGLTGVTAGTAYVRLRLTTQVLVNTSSATLANEDTRSYGPAPDGEVEDYTLTIKANPVSCVTTTTYLDYCNGAWSGQFDDQPRACVFDPTGGSRMVDYLNGISGAATTSYKFTLGNLNPGVSNTLSYTWNTNNPVNPKQQTAKLYIDGVLKDSYTTVLDSSPSAPGSTDFRNKTTSFVPTGTTANVTVTYSVPSGNMVGSDAVISKLDINGSYGSTICTSYDYGDAPTSYGNPKHLIVSGRQLGVTVTPDVGGYQGVNADGDADDGVSLPALSQGRQATVTVSVAGAGGYLQGWIDWNGDGDFADAGEQVAINVQDNLVGDNNNALGTIGVAVTVPATATGSRTYARFRWSATAGLDAATAATDGEVEDYALTILPSTGSLLSGTVYEDTNYGGGAGRNLATSFGVGVGAATVELYDSTGHWLATTTTAVNGQYMFNSVVSGAYSVRVVNDSVRSSRAGSDGSEWPVMTYRSDGVTEMTGQIGGNQPTRQDAGYNSGTSILTSTSFAFTGGNLAGGQAQSVQPVVIGSVDVEGVDFGFNFDTVVNTNDSGQGSLRQFILNSNLLEGENLLAQAGRTASKEYSVFAVPVTDPGYRNPDGIAATGDEYWRISLLTGLPEAKGKDTVLDAASMSGVECNPVGRRLRIELEGSQVAAASSALTVTGARNEVRGFSIGSTTGKTFATGIDVYGTDSSGSATGGHATISCNNIGINPLGVAYPVAIGDAAIHIEADNVTVGGVTPAGRNMIGSTGIVSLGANTSVINNTFGLAGNGETVILGTADLLRFGQGGAVAESNTFAGGGTAVVLSDGSTFRNNLVGFTVSGAQPAGVGAASTAVTVQGGVAGTPILIAGNSVGNAGSAGIGFWGNVSVPVTIEKNQIGVAPDGKTPAGNAGAGINLSNMSTGTALVGGAGQGNQIANNGGAGIVYSGSGVVTISANSLHDNAGLGIDLMNDGVTLNDAGDADTGPNGLLNYPEVKASSFGANGSKILAYDFDLDVPANTNGYRVEFFMNTVEDPSGHGEGETYLGYDDIYPASPGSANFKGLFNANQTVPATAIVSATLTQKLGPALLGETSEFSGTKTGSTTSVCTDLLTDPNAALPDVQVDENSSLITLLEAKDALGQPITYVISGGVDGNLFTIEGPPTGSLFDCPRLVFKKTSSVVLTRSLPVNKAAAAIMPSGNFEYPVDSGRDNHYDVTISAVDSQGKTVSKALQVAVRDVNEAPAITSDKAVTVPEGRAGVIQTITAYDPDVADTGRLVYALSGTDARRFRLDIHTGELRFVIPPDFEQPLDANRDNSYELVVTVADSAGYTGTLNLVVKVTNVDELSGIAVRILLQGAYDSSTDLMSDTLRTLGLLPVTQPYGGVPFSYTGVESISLDLAGVGGANAMVDWVLLELRSVTDFRQRVAARAVLVQRDGDLMDAATGETLLHFTGVAPGNYFVSVRHRNHLGVMTAAPVSMMDNPVQLDFSSVNTLTWGNHARLESGHRALLWAGDTLHDERILLNGTGNDMNPILSAVLSAPDNTGFNGSYRLSGYLPFDLNMDGVTLFMGPGSDVNVLLGNVLLYPGNTGYVGNYVITGGMR